MPQQYENINTQYYLKADSAHGSDSFRISVVDHQGRYIAPFITIAQTSIFISELTPEIARKVGIWETQRIMLGEIDLKEKANTLALVTPMLTSEAA